MRCWLCCSCQVEESYDDHEVVNGPKKQAEGSPKGSNVSAPVKPKKPKTAPTIKVSILSLEEIREKTEFGSKALTGEGSYGRVYYADLNSGKAVAVKKLDDSLEQESDVEFASTWKFP